MNKKITIADLAEAKQQNKKITAVSCYDYTTASLAAQAGIEMMIVGDSAAQLMLGYDSTLPATMDFMVTITAAVHRAAPKAFTVADMPFLSYNLGIYDAIKNAGRFIAEAGADMVKVEANNSSLDIITAISNAGIAVMAHIGIKPQSISKIGRFKAEATTAEMALELIASAKKMVDAGASALLVEGTAAEVAEIITQLSNVPVISCGSGPYCDGQVLVAPDILGLTQGNLPKFSFKYSNLAEKTIDAFTNYAKDVMENKFPDNDHCYHMKTGQLDLLKKMMTEVRS